MSDPTQQDFEYTGGLGIGPCGSKPYGSAFTDENTGPARPDIPVLDFVYEDQPLKLTTDE